MLCCSDGRPKCASVTPQFAQASETASTDLPVPSPVTKPVSTGRQKVREQKKRELRAAANGIACALCLAYVHLVLAAGACTSCSSAARGTSMTADTAFPLRVASQAICFVGICAALLCHALVAYGFCIINCDSPCLAMCTSGPIIMVPQPLPSVLIVHTGGTLGMDPITSYEPDVDGRDRLKGGGTFKGTLGPGTLFGCGPSPSTLANTLLTCACMLALLERCSSGLSAYPQPHLPTCDLVQHTAGVCNWTTLRKC